MAATSKKKKATKKKVALRKKKSSVRVSGPGKARKTAPKGRNKKAAASAMAAGDVKYNCVAGSCTPVPRKKKLISGDTVTLRAIGNINSVTIEFQGASPFVSGHGAHGSPFTIHKGADVTETAKVVAANTPFPYQADCNPQCAHGAQPPEFIVDP